MKKHPKNNFLLQNSKGESLAHSQLTSIMQGIRKRYDIPFEIRGMRHLISSHCKLKLNFDDTQMKKLSEQLGTSMSMLERNYIDYPESRQYNMDDIDKQYVNEIKEMPNSV